MGRSFFDFNKSKPVIWRVGAAPLLQEHSVAHNVGLHANSVVMKNASADVVYITIAGTKKSLREKPEKIQSFQWQGNYSFISFPMF